MSRASSNLRSSVGRRRDMCQLPQPWEGDEGRRRDRYKLVMGDSPKKIQFSFIRFATAKWLNCDWHHIGCRSTWCDIKKYVCKGKVQTKPRKPSFFLQILPTIAFLFFFTTASTDSLDCFRYFWAYPFFYFLVFLFPLFNCWFRGVD